ncbi:Veg family protein [Caldicellulosiruptoraceae bacterium PP1]
MVDKLHLQQLKKDIEAIKGEKILIRANKGRKKMFEVEGILQDTYSNLFVVKFPIDKDCTQYRCVTYTYSDLITNSVEIVLCKDRIKTSKM